MVVFLTLELGKVRGMARGARRARSRFGGSLEIGTEIELTFFETESRELVSVDRCDIIRSRFAQVSDPILATTLGYTTELTDAFVPEREPAPRVYRLLRAVVFSLSDVSAAEARARYFEAWLLRLSGLHPWRTSCPACGKALASLGARFSFEERRLACPSCLGRGVSLSPESLRFLELVWKLPPEEIGPPGSARVLSELGSLHYRLVLDHLEKELKSHPVLEQMLRGDVRP